MHTQKPNPNEPTPLRKVGLIYTGQTKRAMDICFDAHKDQRDKNGLPYVFHPFHLAEQMETEEEVCVALLHDVMEDSDYTQEDLRQAGFSEAILEALRCMTHDPAVPYMDYVSALRKNPLARKVKQADLLHNSDLSRRALETQRDKRRWLKYRIALAILEDDWYDWLLGYYRKRIPLDDEQLCFLSVFYHEGGNVVKYSFDVEEASDYHYQFSPAAGELLRLRIDPGLSLPEALAEFLLHDHPRQFPALLAGQGLPFQSFHYN